MALSYVLEMETNIEAQILSNMINNYFYFPQQEVIIIVDKIDELDGDVTESLFDFRPNLAVMFRVNSQHNHHYAFKFIAKITLFILKEIVGNAILLFNEEIMIMQRINELLIFNEQEWKMLSGFDISSMILKAIPAVSCANA